ncbi:hypothetical protein Drorol1_Dr00011429 [Drosera rotundifolia]
MATTTVSFTSPPTPKSSHHRRPQPPPQPLSFPPPILSPFPSPTRRQITCKATDLSSSSASAAASAEAKEEKEVVEESGWVPVVPLAALPKGERRVILQDGETILLLWYKGDVFAVENRSPAEGAYTEGLLNAKLTQDGCIVCPSTDSTFDLRTGAIKEWYPKNPVLRALTPATRPMFIYPVKTDGENIFINMGTAAKSNVSAEIVFSGKAQPGVTATDVNVDEVRMVIDESQEGFGFTRKNELINGKAAAVGFLLLLDIELLTGSLLMYLLEKEQLMSSKASLAEGSAALYHQVLWQSVV